MDRTWDKDSTVTVDTMVAPETEGDDGTEESESEPKGCEPESDDPMPAHNNAFVEEKGAGG
jgi:hypothetical protein